MLTLKMPFETMDTVDIIDAVIEGTKVDSMVIDPSITEKYRSLVDLYYICTNTVPEERPSIDTIIKELGTLMSHGNITLRVERKPSLVEQLNRYNLGGNSRAAVDREPNLDFEMESEISRATSSTVKYGGPQNQLDSARRLPAPLGLSSDRDSIMQGDDVTESETVDEPEEESKTETPESTATIARLQRSMSKFGGFVDPRKRKKDKKNGKLEMVKRPRKISNVPPPEDPATGKKQPKRNTISKTTLQKMVDDPDSINQ